MVQCWNARAAYGRKHALYVAYNVSRLFGFAQIYVTRSAKGRAAFARPALVDRDVSVDDPTTGGGDYEPAIAVAPRSGRLYVAFERFSADFDRADVFVTASSNRGRTWAAPVQVSRLGQNAVNGRVELAVSRTGAVYVAWVDASDVDFDADSGQAAIEVAASRDGGRTFDSSTVAQVPSGCGPNEDCGNRYPSVTVAAGGARTVYLAWSSGDFPNPARISVARSLTGGRSWSGARQLPVPAKSDKNDDEFAPSLGVAPDGRIDLAYADEARDADTGALDVYAVHSVDRAASFSVPRLLDSAPSDSRRGTFAAAVSVASSNKALSTSWLDARAGAAADRSRNVYFAAVNDEAAPSRPRVRLGSAGDGRRTYTFSSADEFAPTSAIRYRCSFDGAALHACDARYSQPLRPGSHVLRVVALDPAGNRSAPTKVSLTVAARPVPSRPGARRQ
jgi:hypothetical protein